MALFVVEWDRLRIYESVTLPENEVLMKIALLVFLCVLCSNSQELRPTTPEATSRGTSDRSTTRKVSISFTGTVKSIEQLGERQLQVIPVDFDSRFAITVHIEAVTPSDVPLKVDTDRIFAVHSPAQLFGVREEEIIGKKYRFKVAWSSTRTSSRFYELKAIPIVDDGM